MKPQPQSPVKSMVEPIPAMTVKSMVEPIPAMTVKSMVEPIPAMNQMSFGIAIFVSLLNVSKNPVFFNQNPSKNPFWKDG